MGELDDTMIVSDVFDFAAREQQLNWVPLNPGVEISYLYRDQASGAAAAYIRYAPNASVDPHQHLGYEHVFVLAGEQSDEVHSYKAGSLAIQPPNSRHRIRSENGCVVLVIWSAALNFDGE